MIPETIVVPLDGSDFATHAVPVATALAARSGARVVLVRTPLAGDTAQVADYLRGIAAAAGGDPEIVVAEERDPARAILRVASERPGSLLCMSTHGRGGLRWAVLGSIAEEVLLSTDRPVLLVGPLCEPDWDPGTGHVVVCHDGSETTGLVTAAACDLATSLGEHDVWVATVIHPLDVASAEHPDRLFAPVEASIAERGLRAHPELSRSSFPAGGLADIAHDLPASFVVMATHGRTGMARVVVGSCTMGLVGLATCPVLVRAVPRS